MEWFDAKTNPPKKAGRYLCLLDYGHPCYEVISYTTNLQSVDEFDFRNEKRPGWYAYDSEWGYVERHCITHWMPLPELPNA